MVGAMLAQEGDVEQTHFFKSFVKECLTFGTRHQAEVQLATINTELTADEIDLLSMITFKD